MMIMHNIRNCTVKATTNLFVVALSFILLFCTINIRAQESIRFKNEVFQNIDSVTNIVYGNAVNVKGENEELKLDIFSPHNDSVKYRPLLIFIHGGGYFFGNLSKRNGSLMSEKSYCLLTQLCDLN